jgi:hypothetical protein
MMASFNYLYYYYDIFWIFFQDTALVSKVPQKYVITFLTKSLNIIWM